MYQCGRSDLPVNTEERAAQMTYVWTTQGKRRHYGRRGVKAVSSRLGGIKACEGDWQGDRLRTSSLQICQVFLYYPSCSVPRFIVLSSWSCIPAAGCVCVQMCVCVCSDCALKTALTCNSSLVVRATRCPPQATSPSQPNCLMHQPNLMTPLPCFGFAGQFEPLCA